MLPLVRISSQGSVYVFDFDGTQQQSRSRLPLIKHSLQSLGVVTKIETSQDQFVQKQMVQKHYTDYTMR